MCHAFQKIPNKNCKPNKIWVDKGSEVCNKSIKLRLERNAIEMDSTHDKRKSVAVELFIRS